MSKLSVQWATTGERDSSTLKEIHYKHKIKNKIRLKLNNKIRCVYNFPFSRPNKESYMKSLGGSLGINFCWNGTYSLWYIEFSND